MKRIFLLAYSKMNLGDDLFIDILVNRYKDVQFYTRAIQENTYIHNKNENLHFKDYTLDDLAKISIKEFDAIVYIGGSIFMEHAGGVERIEKLNTIASSCKKNNVPFFFISSNFGPYKSQEYLIQTEKLFENITDICFRDKQSYEQFKDNPTVRYAPDVVLSYNIPFQTQKDTIGISIIDFKYRDELKKYKNVYYEVLKSSIINYIKQGKIVTLFSFCEYEGDEEAINLIISELPTEISRQINVETYKGEIDSFIKKYSRMEYFLCSRFHSVILSAVFKQKASVISYSSKMANVINELHLSKQYYNIEQLSEIKDIKLEDFNILDINDFTVEQSQKQFKELDRFVKQE